MKNLNAQFVGGLGAAQLESTGGFGVAHSVPLTTRPAPVVDTGDLPAGVYYVNANAYMLIGTGGQGGFCWIQARGGTGDYQSATGAEGAISAAETTAVFLPHGGRLEEWCGTFKTSSHSVA